mgnify:CR=1 FL=1
MVSNNSIQFLFQLLNFTCRDFNIRSLSLCTTHWLMYHYTRVSQRRTLAFCTCHQQHRKLETHFYVFAVRCLDQWLSWEEVKFYAALFDLPTVPELRVETVEELTREALQQQIVSLAQEPGVFGTRDPQTGADCTREGVVTRNIGEYPVSEFARNVFKYVRKGHVKTDEHWTRNWKRARLIWEIGKEE